MALAFDGCIPLRRTKILKLPAKCAIEAVNVPGFHVKWL
jgi:hypothetical protein